MKYPLRNDYDTALRLPHIFILDGTLKKGKPVKQKRNPNFFRSHNGGKAVVYEILTNPRKYALKCWVEDLGDLKVRYKAIDEYLKKVQLPYFVDFAYQEQGILVNGNKFPIVRMEWVDGTSFKKFISSNLNNPVNIRNLADQFLEMMTILHQNHISHGDLQHGNVMVRQNGDICLIDYDSLYVPQLSNQTDDIKGLPGYQHPNRDKLQKLNPKADYFSELVIYLSLLVLSENPNYWQQIEQEERLLFSEKDLVTPQSSKIIQDLKNLSPEIVYFTQELEKFCCESNIENLEPLENLVNNYTGSTTSWDFVLPPNLPPIVTPPPPVVSNPTNWAFPPNPNPASYPSPSSQGWDFSLNGTQQTPSQTSPKNTTPSDPWSKLDTNLSSQWDKFDTSQTPAQPDWDKITQPHPREPQLPIPDNNIWDKFDNIWNKFDDVWSKVKTSVSSIWDRIWNWFK